MESGILSNIGHTPLRMLEQLFPEFPVQLYAKLEMFNPGGSIKDRPALLMISEAMKGGELEPGDTVIESSSGNMAIGLAQVCRYYGLELIAVVDPKINGHTLKILQAYGARIEKVTEADDDGNYLAARLHRVQELVSEIPGSYWPNQYANRLNPVAHYYTMKEIVKVLPAPPDYLLAATSTCGTLMGCADYVRENNLQTKLIAVDAVGSVIFGTPPADRLVPGHGAGRPSKLLDKNAVDQVIHITDEECITGCRRLLNGEAILAGGSSGAVVLAAEKLCSQLSDGATAALILPDSGERYLDTIYNDEWVQEHFGEIKGMERGENGLQPPIFSALNIPSSDKNNGQHTAVRKIAIVGGGPKGMYGFERLAAQFKAHPPERLIEIHVFNKSSHFGSGDIYRPGQPGYLLMNNPAGEINLWIEEDPPAVVSEPLSMTDWLQQVIGCNNASKEYVSRGMVGQYLSDGFQAIAANLPPGVRGAYIAGDVEDVLKDSENEKYRLRLRTAAGGTETFSHRYDHILLATGHPRNRPTLQEEKYHQFAESKSDLAFVPFIYPVESTLSGIRPGSKVAMKGMGLTFVDAVLALTEGRGGTFEDDLKNDGLIYQPSGHEPEAIYPFSRSGLPMLPRKAAPEKEVPLQFFTESALNELEKNSVDKLNFKNQIWPLLKREMVFAFYHVQMKQADWKDDLYASVNFTEVQHHVDRFHRRFPEADSFDPDTFLKPLKDKRFSSGPAFHQFIRSYLQFFLKEAKKGEGKSPWAAVTGVWRKATPLFGRYYAFGGLTPESQRFFDHRFRRLLNRVTFGPPVESTAKLLALMDAGLLNFGMARNPELKTDKEAFVLKSSDDNTSASCLVDARISNVSLRDDRSPLYRNMLRRGLISLYENRSERDACQPGCINISPEGFVIGKEGKVNTSIAVTGTPTEGITFDNDALSRSRNNFVSGWAKHIRKIYAGSKISRYADG